MPALFQRQVRRGCRHGASGRSDTCPRPAPAPPPPRRHPPPPFPPRQQKERLLTDLRVELDIQHDQHVALLETVRQALADNRVDLYLQPVVNLPQRRTVFYDINERRTLLPGEYRADAEHLLGLIAAGTLIPRPAEILRLDQAAEAHRRVASGKLHQRLVIRP